jgi:hypothetical protein
MIACNFKAPNGEPSQLYKDLELNFGPDKATQIWNYTKSQQFTDEYEPDLDNNQEPTIEWIKSNINLPKPISVLQQKAIEPTEYTLHSGGAVGADTEWGVVGQEFGITNINHYWHGNKTPNGNTQITDEQLEEGWQKVLLANKKLNRRPEAYKSLLSRNWFQVKNSDALFAIINGIDKNDNVMGGTGWAVQMAKDAGKPVYVFDQKVESWYQWDGEHWQNMGTPTLTRSAGVVGSRELTEAGKKAIRDVYEKTFSVPRESEPAIITLDDFGTADKTKRISYEDAVDRVTELFEQARNTPQETFDATEFKIDNINKPTSNGFTPLELATLFAQQRIPANIKWDPTFEALIANTTPYIAAEITQASTQPLLYTEEALQDVLDQIKVSVRDKEGNKTGKYFTSEQERAAVDTIVSLVRMYYANDDTVTIRSLLGEGGTIKNRLLGHKMKYDLGFELPVHLTKEQAKAWGENIGSILNSWSEFVSRALYKLQVLGLSPKDKNALQSINSLLESEDVIDNQGKGLVDWSDSSFELDPRDTASTRVKLFIASLRDVTIGTEREPSTIDLPFSNQDVRDRILGKNAIAGRKTETIRSADSVKGLKKDAQYLTKVDNVKIRVTVGETLTEQDLDSDRVKAIAAEEGTEPKAGDVVLKLEEWRPRKDVVVPKENFLGFAELVDFDDVFQKLMETLHDVPNNIGQYISALEAEGRNFKPIFLEVANRLKNESKQVQNEFIKVMSKQYQEFNILLHSRRRDGFMDMTPINANQGSAVQSIVKQWRENQKNASIVERDSAGNLVLNESEAQKLVERLETLQVTYQNAATQQGELPQLETELKPFAKHILEANGIVLGDAAFDYLFAHASQVTKNTSLSGSIHEQFKVSAEGKPLGIFSAIVMKLGGLIEEDEVSDDALLNNNPLYTENTAIGILAKLTYKFSPKAAATSHYNSENKSIYAFGMNSHLSQSVRKLINDPAYREQLATTHLGRNSWLLTRLNSSSKARDAFQLQYVDGMKESYKRNADGVQRPSMSSREQLLFAMGQFQHQRSNYVNFLSLTHADKSATPLFTGILKFNVGKANTLPAAVQDAIWKTFLGEYERVKAWYSGVVENGNPTQNEAYNNGGHLYYFFPHMNYESMLQFVEDGVITKQEMQLVWLDEKQPNTRTNVIQLKPLTLRLFGSYWLIDEKNKLVEKMKAEGFNAGLVDHSYLLKNLAQIDAKVISGHFFIDNKEVTNTELMDVFLPWTAKDFILNYFLFHTALSSLIYGDPALTYKGKEGQTEDQQISATLQEYQKRLAKDIAPGHDATWDTPSYSALTIQDDERVHKYLESLAKYRGELINGTDAQELTTVEEHLYVMKSLGLIKDNVYNEMIQIIEEGQKTKDQYYEFTKPEHNAVIMQIMKPVSVSPDFTEVPGTMVMHYVKSSSLSLYPPVTHGMEIDELRKAMESKKIARANFASAKKVGLPTGKGLKIFDANGNLDINLDNMSKYVQTISRDGLRIQQDIPYDEFKDEILTGSQMNKLFTDDIQDKRFVLDNQEYTGAQLKALKEDLRKQLFTIQLNEFKNSVGAEVVDGNLRILDKNKLLSVLEEEAIARDYSIGDLMMIRRKVQGYAPDGSPIQELAIPLFFNPSSDKFESLLMSLVKKIGQVYMPGKSYIQASSAGFKFKDKKTFESLSQTDKNKIIWVPGYNGEELTTMTPGSPAKVLIPFQFLVNDKEGNLQNVNAEDYIVQDKDGNQVLDLTKIPKELLELIGFRIPTQKQNSMLPLQVAGFLPTNMGDTIIVPEAITRQMGSDFDVDKLYVYRRAYNYHSSDKSFSPVTGEDKTGIINRYFNVMWAVLSSPDMYETVMQPLDTNDLKLEAQRATATQEAPRFFSPLTQLEDFLSQKDAKVMVGITSQFNTFYSWIQDKKLQSILEDKPSGVRFIPENSEIIEHAYNLSGKATTVYYDEDKEGTKHTRTRMDDSVTIQNEVLDHAKNRTVDKLNINLNTIHVAEALIALASDDGYKASWKHTALFLRQPAIVELSDELSRGSDSLSTTFETDLTNKTIARLINKYFVLGGEEATNVKDIVQFLTSHDYDVIDIEKLKENLDDTKDVKDFYLRQAGMLYTFARLNVIGKEMAKIQRAFNQDPKGPGKSMIEAFDSLANTAAVLDSSIISGVDQLTTTEQGFVHDQELNVVVNTLQDVLPYSTVQALVNEVLSNSGRRQLSVQDQKEIVRSFKAYVFSNQELGLSDDPNADRFRLLYGQGEDSPLAQRVWDEQQTNQNYFLQRLQPQIASTTNTPSYVFYQASKTSALDDQENMAAFVDLLADEKTKRLAEDLIRYAYVVGGQSSSFNFLRYISPDILVALPFAAKLREIASTLSSAETAIEHTAFIEQFIRHNPRLMRKIGPGMLLGKELPGEKFTLRIPETANDPVRAIVDTDSLGRNYYPQYVSYFSPDTNSWHLFKQQDSSRDYRRIDTLGNSYVSEYTYASNTQRSIFTENRALIKPKDSIVKSDQTIAEQDITHNELPALTDLGVKDKTLDRTDSIILLADISENDKVAKSLQPIAMYLADTLAELKTPVGFTFKNTSESPLAGVGGELNIDSGIADIFVSPKDNATDVARTLVHEALHNLTSLFTFLPVSEQKKHKTAYNALQKVKEVQQEALGAVVEEAEREGYTTDDLDAFLMGTKRTPDQRAVDLANMFYLVKNYDEFLSGIWESTVLQRFLNNTQSKLENKSLLKRVIAFVQDFLAKLGKSLGVTINDNSMLKIGLERSFKFMEEVKKLGAERKGLEATISNTFFDGKAPSEDGTWLVESLDEAKNIVKELNSELPMAKANWFATPEGYKVVISLRNVYSVNLAPTTQQATNPIDKVYGKVQEQMKLIRASIAQNKKTPDVLHQSRLLAELRALANDMKATQDLERIKTLANYQIDWAQKVKDKFLAQNKPVSNNQLMTAYRLLGIWTGTLSMIYNGADLSSNSIVYDEDFSKIQGRAETLHNEFSSNIMRSVFQSASQTGVTAQDFESMEDMLSGEAQFLDISRAKSKVTQEAALTIQNTHRQYLEEGQDLLKEIKGFEDKVQELASSRGLKKSDIYRQLIQEGADWGIINRYSPAFYKWRAGLRHKLNKEIEDFEKNISDEKLRSASIKKSYERYWRFLDKKAGFINVQILFDKDGNESPQAASVKYRQDMINEYGQAFTDQVIAEAKKKYQQYLEDKEDIFDMYDTQLEEDLMTAEEVEEAKSAWELENSPIEKLTSRILVTNNKYLNLGEKYLVLVPHKNSTSVDGKSFFDQQYDKIQNDEQLREVHSQLQDFMRRFKSNLPYYVEAKLGDSFLAAIRKELLTSVADVPGYLKGAPARVRNMLTASSYEEFMQQQTEKEIPILYTENPFEHIARPAAGAPEESWKAYEAKKKEQLKNYTTDLPRILELFGLMSLHYKNFSEARDAIELAEEVIKKVDSDMRNGMKQINKNGKIVTVNASLKNTLAALEYTKDVLMFKRGKGLQGKMGEINIKRDKTATKKLKDLEKELQAVEEKFDKHEMTIPEYQEATNRLQTEIRKYETRRVYASKVGDTLITWTQLKSLSYNPLSAINNLAFGLISATVHANGKQDFNWKDFRKGFSIMMNATGRSLGLAKVTGNDSNMHKTAEKILNIMDRMNVMGELTDTEFSNSNLSQKRKGLRSAISPYQMLRTGDYFVKGLVMVAMLHHETVKVNGVDTPLWKLINQEGKYTTEEANQVPWEVIRNKIIGVNKIIMGNFDKSSPMLAKKNILFRLMGQFRLSWFSEGIASRVESERYDAQLGRIRKGRYRTYQDLGFFQSLSIILKQMLSALPGVKIDPFNNASFKKGKHFTDTDRANMRRNLAEIAWFLSIYSVVHMLGVLANGDDEDKKKWYTFWMNMGIRSYQDVALYSNPSVLDQIIGTPAPALGTVRDVQKFLSATGKLMTDNEYTYEQWLLKLTRAGFIPQTTLINRFHTMTTKDISTIQR